MSKLIKLQLRNVFYNKLFYVCLGLVLLMSPVLTFIDSLNSTSTETLKVLPQIISFMSNEIGLMSIIFIALFVCFDFNEGTTKNIIARGYTKKQLLFSKYIVSIVGIFMMYIILAIVTFILFAKNGIGYESNMLGLFINCIGRIITYIVFYSTISFLLEKNGSAIIACLFVPTIISAVLALIDSNLKIKISEFWLDNVSNSFIANSSLENLSYSIVFYLIYTIIFIIVGNQLIKKKEIK